MTIQLDEETTAYLDAKQAEQEAPPNIEAEADLEVLEYQSEQLLDDVLEFLKAYIVFTSDHEATSLALWVAHTYMLGWIETTPRLVVHSPSKQTGKTRVFEVLTLLVKDGRLVVDMSVATFFRLIDQQRPTILQDEADALFANTTPASEEKRACYNAGYRKGAFVERAEQGGQNLTKYSIFAAVAFAGIGDMPDTIMDRAIVLNMRRKLKGEQTHPFRARHVREPGKRLQKRLQEWATSEAARMEDDPEMPDEISDRQKDIWEPLIAIADLAGGSWGHFAREACIHMTRAQAVDDADSAEPLRLLRDLRSVWPENKDRATTDALLNRLRSLDESEWAGFEYSNLKLDGLKMSRLLRPYGVKPKQFRLDGVPQRGYKRADLQDVWDRYL